MRDRKPRMARLMVTEISRPGTAGAACVRAPVVRIRRRKAATERALRTVDATAPLAVHTRACLVHQDAPLTRRACERAVQGTVSATPPSNGSSDTVGLTSVLVFIGVRTADGACWTGHAPSTLRVGLFHTSAAQLEVKCSLRAHVRCPGRQLGVECSRLY